MKTKTLILLLITAMLMSTCIINGSAKEVDSLAQIAAYSKLEPVGVSEGYKAFDKLSEVSGSMLPSSYSSRDLGYTTPVRQQTSNICWAYSSLASLESYVLKSGRPVTHFSPQHMNIWGSMQADGTGWQRENLVNDGGYSYIPMGYLTSWGGPLYDYELPIDSDKTAYNNANSLYSADYGITGIKYINRDTPRETIKQYIMNYGAVIANFSADTVKYMNASSEAFYCGDASIATNQLYGHSVSIVGWDDNYAKENFSSSYSHDTPANNGAWLIKNSWGTYVNENGGYFWISYEDAWLFHSIFGPSFAISEFEELDGSKYIYQNEIYGATTQFHYLTDETNIPADEITYINVYDFTEEYSVLDKVVFESTSYDADYTVYYIPVFGGKPTQETYLWQQLATGTIDYTGYISVDTNNFTLPEGEGAIGIAIDNTRTYNENKNNPGYEYISNSIGVCEWLAFNGGYYFKNQGVQGDSFVMYKDNGTTITYDVMDFYKKHWDDSMGCTFVIKAIAEDPGFVPDASVTEPTIPDPTEETLPGQDNVISLAVTLEYIGNNILTVIAKADGGSGDYEFEFKLDGKVFQDYSETNYASITITKDGDYSLQVSAKEKGSNKVIISQSTVTVKDGKILSDGQELEVTEIATTEALEVTEQTTTEFFEVMPTVAPPYASAATTAPQDSQVCIIGDVDQSGEISIKDATLIRKHLAKLSDFDDITMAIADVDASGKCNISDATNIQKFIALIETNTNVGKSAVLYR